MTGPRVGKFPEGLSAIRKLSTWRVSRQLVEVGDAHVSVDASQGLCLVSLSLKWCDSGEVPYPSQDSNLKLKDLRLATVWKPMITNSRKIWLPTLDTFRTLAA